VTKAGRTGYAKGFGDVGFRLKVGEIGVSPWKRRRARSAGTSSSGLK